MNKLVNELEVRNLLLLLFLFLNKNVIENNLKQDGEKKMKQGNTKGRRRREIKRKGNE